LAPGCGWGDFSGVAKGSFLVEKGKRTAPVKETLIAGNVFDALQRIVACGAERHRVMATMCPWVLVDGVDVTAGG
jgi:PmbA protein